MFPSHDRKREVQIQDLKENYEIGNEYLITHNNFHEEIDKEQFWGLLDLEMKEWDKEALRENEKKVLDAIFDIFSRRDNIEIFNKKAIYLYLRELTGLTTKQIVSNLNRFRIKYRLFKEKWDKGDA